MARYIAKNMVAAGVADEVLVQLAYAIGKAEPVSVYVNTYGRKHVAMSDGEIAAKIKGLFDLKLYEPLPRDEDYRRGTVHLGETGPGGETERSIRTLSKCLFC